MVTAIIEDLATGVLALVLTHQHMTLMLLEVEDGSVSEDLVCLQMRVSKWRLRDSP